MNYLKLNQFEAICLQIVLKKVIWSKLSSLLSVSYFCETKILRAVHYICMACYNFK